MHFQVSLFYFALLIFLVKNGAESKGLHGYINVCLCRAVDFFKWSDESARLHLVNRTIDALRCIFMNTTLPRETLRSLHIFCVVYFEVSDIYIWQL